MKIQTKLFLLLTGFSLVLLSAFVFLMQWSIDKGMIEYANAKEAEALKPFVAQLQQVYVDEQGWQGLTENPRRFKFLLESALNNNAVNDGFGPRPERRPPPRGHGEKPRPPHDRPGPAGHPDNGRGVPPQAHRGPNVSFMLVDAQKSYLVGRYIPEFEYSYTPIVAEQTIVGYFAISKRSHLTQGYELDFVQQQKSVLYYSAFGIALFVLLFTLPLSRHLLSPIKALASNIHSLTQGRFETHDYPPRKDELGQLQQDQNNLAIALQQNEQARKRWLANTSHELRTPVAVLKGEIEAILDGIRGNTTENIESLLHEVEHLTTLIEDLQQLNSSELGGMQFYKTTTEISQLVEHKVNNLQGYIASNNMTLRFQPYEGHLNVDVDQTRIKQVIENICQNSVKYAGVGCEIDISVTKQQDIAIVTIADNGPGVASKDLPNLFEYLYRAESSRNRKLGGSGLGLAICKHIIEGHSGTIVGRTSKSGGLAIEIRLPLI